MGNALGSFRLVQINELGTLMAGVGVLGLSIYYGYRKFKKRSQVEMKEVETLSFSDVKFIFDHSA